MVGNSIIDVKCGSHKDDLNYAWFMSKGHGEG